MGNGRHQMNRSASALTVFVIVLCVATTDAAIAQAPNVGGMSVTAPPPLLPVPPSVGDGGWPSFVKSLSTPEGAFELIIGQGRLLTLARDLTVAGKPSPLIAVGDPTVADFDVVGPRQIRLTGQRIGATDLSIITADGESFSVELRVVPDLTILRAHLRATFPDALVELASVREHVIVEGQARDARQVAQILQLIDAYLASVQPGRTSAGGSSALSMAAPPVGGQPVLSPQEAAGRESPAAPPLDFEILPEPSRPAARAPASSSQVINLLRVPGPQQVLLKVQIAELNRTALRQLGTSFLFQNETNAIGSAIGPAYPPLDGSAGGLLGLLNPAESATSTVFGVLDRGNANLFVNALRRNQVLTILAEPNLVAMHGQEASFLSGGEFPVPVPQPGSTGGLVTIEYRPFGVGLTFVPYLLDGDTIRLSVAPEVSSIDFATGVTIQGTAVPGLATRRTSTVVQLKEGQTLAISGILQVEMDGSTSRIPGLGDLPYIGAMFRSNSTETVEKELVVLVTPYLIEPICADQPLPLPGADVLEPDDHEFYLKGRIEKRSARPFRATAAWDDPLGIEHRRKWESRFMYGPYGYSE